MVRTKYLDQSQDGNVADLIMQLIEEEGFSIEEAIPGLVTAIIYLAEKSNFREEILDEAANLLADGGE